LVSVLLTAYNRERYVASAIESVLAQGFTDFELVVVDDASTDATVPVARRYEDDPRVRVVVNEGNLGQFGNRNRAAALARGEFIKYHDSDDLMYPHCLGTMVGVLAAEPMASFALSTGWHWPGGPCPMLLTPRMAYQREFLGPGLFMCGPASALFRTEAFRRLGGFPERGVGSDYLFWLRACATEHVVLAPADLFWYRLHSHREFERPVAARDYALIPGEAWRALGTAACPLTEAEREQARRNVAYIIAKLCWRDLRARRLAVSRLRVRLAGLGPRDWLRYLRPPRRQPLAGTPLDAQGEYLVPRWIRGTPAAREVPEAHGSPPPRAPASPGTAPLR
jgi:glycosyltransferase involved in cell wall biosynthesis